MRRFKRLKILLIPISAGFLFAGIGVLWFASLKIPDFQTIQSRLITESTKIYDRTGEVVLYNLQDNVRRQVVPYADISKHIKNATVAIEDDEFYEHKGVKPMAILRALLVDLGSGQLKQGGSTITQQLVKNSLLNQEKKITRKIKEMILALKIEQVLSKEEILNLYLNEAPYGGAMYGVEEATQTFFNKAAKDVTLAEAAYIAAIPKAPTFYSPYGNNREALESRKNTVLARMQELGFVGSEEYQTAMAETVHFVPPSDQGIKAPHFVLWVRDYLENKYGKELIRTRGFKVITTLDAELQREAEAIVAKYGADNSKQFNANNAGLVAIDPKTGEILVMVGSRDYFNIENEGNFNITLSHRQPGSAFKPFVYATAFNKGYTPETIVFDLPTEFDTNCASDPSRCYRPTNYDLKYRGPITFRNALAQSVNIPAIKVLYLAGIRESIKTAQLMGITSLGDSNRYGLTLVLGGGEVSLLDMTSAYGVFANDGVRLPYSSILSVEDSEGNVLEKATVNATRAIPTNTARLITSILTDNEARAPAFDFNSPLHFPGRQVAAKTGTTNDYRDAWILGYTPNLAVGAWAGNNDNTPMEKRVAGFIVAPMWHSFMEKALAKRPVENFLSPEPTPSDLKPIMRGFWRGGQNYLVDKISGKLATENTPPDLREERVVTSVHSILYWVDRNNPRGEAPVRPQDDPQFELWEGPVRTWAANQSLFDESVSVIPTDHDDVHQSGNRPEIKITEPDSNDGVDKDKPLTVTVRLASQYPIEQVDYFLNGTFLGSSRSVPYSLTFIPKEIDNLERRNELRVVVYDQVKNQGEDTITLEID